MSASAFVSKSALQRGSFSCSPGQLSVQRQALTGSCVRLQGRLTEPQAWKVLWQVAQVRHPGPCAHPVYMSEEVGVPRPGSDVAQDPSLLASLTACMQLDVERAWCVQGLHMLHVHQVLHLVRLQAAVQRCVPVRTQQW